MDILKSLNGRLITTNSVQCPILGGRTPKKMEVGAYELSNHKWTYDRVNIEMPFYITRNAYIYTSTDRYHICKIYSSSVNNRLSKHKMQGPNPGRPLEQSPIRLLCSKCGKSTDIISMMTTFANEL